MLRAALAAAIFACLGLRSIAQTEPVGPETPLNLPPNPVPAPTLPPASPKPGDTNQYPETNSGYPADTNQYPTYTGTKPAPGPKQTPNTAPGSPP